MGTLPSEADLRQASLHLLDVAAGDRAVDITPGQPGAIGTE
jgi:hypothetical protein